MERMRAFVRRQPAVCVVLLAELCILLLGFARQRPAEPQVLLSDGLTPCQETVTAGPDGVDVPAGLTGDVITSRWLTLPAGICNVTVAYRGGGEDVNIRFHDYVAVYADCVPLPAEQNAVTFQAYVPSPGVTQATLRVACGGSAVTVQSIVLQPSRATRWYWLLCAGSLFLAADAVWLLWTRRLVLPGGAGAHTAALGVAAVALLATLPALLGSLVQGHDLMFHLDRLQGLLEGLLAGQFPVRIQPFWLLGRGYAVSVFYGDAFLYPFALLRVLGVSVQGAYKCYVAAINLATAWVTYACLHKMLRDRLAALTGCALYTLSAYRLIALYTRAAVGEYTAMLFLPLIVYGLWRIFTLPKHTAPPRLIWLPAVLGYTGLLQCHVLSCEIAGALTLLLCLVLVRRVCQRNVFFSLCRVVLVTAVLNLGFLVPFLEFFRGAYKFNDPSFVPLAIQPSGVFLGQLFALFFGGDTLAYDKASVFGAVGDMAVGLGLVPLCGALLFVVCTLRGADRTRPAWRLGDLCLWSGAACILFTLPFFPWDALAALHPAAARLIDMLQYLWRFLGPATLFWTITTACAIVLCRPWAELRRLAVLGLAVLSLAGWAYFAESYRQHNAPFVCYSAAALNSKCGKSDEYLPLAADQDALTTRREVTADGGVALGEATIRYLTVTVPCESESGGTVTVPVVNYPYYRAVDDSGNALPTGQAPSGELTVTVPAGFAGSFTVFWQEPWHWRLAEAASVLCAAALAVCVWRQRKKRPAA